MTKYVYSFGRGRAEGSSLMRNLLGGKGCELAEMTNLGIPVPPGLTITTQAWAAYDRTGRQFPEGLWEQVDAGIEKLQHAQHEAHETDSVEDEARVFVSVVIPAQNELREVADELETLVADDLWPLPKYRELLFQY